jgi:hypothetical protein
VSGAAHSGFILMRTPTPDQPRGKSYNFDQIRLASADRKEIFRGKANRHRELARLK